MQEQNSSVKSLQSQPNLSEIVLAELTPEAAEALEWDWPTWARPSQVPPDGDWLVWLVLAGRGWGKTRTGAEWVRAQAASNTARRIALVAPTAADARDVMVEGHSGILSVGHPDERPTYEPSKRRLTWPNGVIATTFSADEPDRLRGPQFHAAWCDELAAWRYPEAWDMLQFGLRMGHPPRTVVTTTPRPVRLIRELLASPSTEVTRGATYENRANLSEAFLQRIAARYEGTRLGRQEVHAELLDDVEGALWQRRLFQSIPDAPDLLRVVVAIDPAVSYNDGADETGIVVAGRGVDGSFYVLADRSCRLSPDGWARRAVRAHREFAADRIIGEVNNGGELVESVLRTVDGSIPYKAVRASRGKLVRAEPIAALYEQGKVFHVGPGLEDLEDQLCTWTPESGASPDRLDALVWALTELNHRTEIGVWV